MTSTIFGEIGPYRIERPIGQGGMASVFLARDSRDDRRVALKVIHLGDDEEARDILESEQRGAELQRRLSAQSSYVPQLYETGFTNGHFYVAMEYIEGEDLSQFILRGRLSWDRAVQIAVQLCEFLEQAELFDVFEGQVILHNDLKPRNIRLFSENGLDRIKVLDFGAAKPLDVVKEVTRNDFGTTAYLSPETLESGNRDMYSDSWSLGVLLYEMVRGQKPFVAEDTRRLEKLITSRANPEPLFGYCPPSLAAVVAKMLAPYSGDRYDGPASIRADLMKCLDGDVTVAEQESWPKATKVPDIDLADVDPGSIIIAWDPEVVSAAEYAGLVTALGNLSRALGGLGIRRIRHETCQVLIREVVPL